MYFKSLKCYVVLTRFRKLCEGKQQFGQRLTYVCCSIVTSNKSKNSLHVQKSEIG